MENTLPEEQIILTLDTIDGLASALILREAVGNAQIRISGSRADRLHETLAAIDHRTTQTLWITAQAPSEEFREFISYEQGRLMNGVTWINWLDHHHWPAKKKQWFRQYSKMKIINDHRRQGFEICAASYMPVPRPPEVLAICAAMYRMPVLGITGLELLRPKLKSMARKTMEGHKVAEQWISEFRPTMEQISSLIVSADYCTPQPSADRLEVLTGRKGSIVVQIDGRDGSYDSLSKADRREMLMAAQIKKGAFAGVMMMGGGKVFLMTTEYRLPTGISAIVERFRQDLNEANGTGQTQTLVFKNENTAKKIAPFLAEIEPKAASNYDMDTPEGLYAAGMADLYEGQRSRAKERLYLALDEYKGRQNWEIEAPPQHMQHIPPWPLRAEAALWVLDQK